MKRRELNIELLRILSMLSIVYLHFESIVKSQSVFDEAVKSTIYTLSSFGLNTFVLITGYFMINKTEIKLNRFIKVFIQTVFYTVLLTAIFYMMGKASFSQILVSFYPFSPSRLNYWFVSHYLALMLLQPFLSRLALSLSKRLYTVLLIILITLSTEMFSVFPLGYLFSSPWKVWWFICLFFTGGYLRLHLPDHLDKKRFSLRLVIAIAFVFFIQVVKFSHISWIKIDGYNSLTEYLYSVMIFIIFRQIHITKGAGLINFISPCVFSVYLIHCHFYIYQYLKFAEVRLYNSIPINNVCFVLLFCMFIFIICVCIDRIRLYLYALCKIPEYELKLSDWLRRKSLFYISKLIG